MRHRPYFLRRGGAVAWPPTSQAEGMARREGAACGRVHLARARCGAFRRATRTNRSGFICGVFTAVPGRALPTERFARSPAAISRRLLGQPFLRSLGLCLASAVSELLAGTRSGPGRGPGTARVRGYEPRPRAPHSRPPFGDPARTFGAANLHRTSVRLLHLAASRVDAPRRARHADYGPRLWRMCGGYS